MSIGVERMLIEQIAIRIYKDADSRRRDRTPWPYLGERLRGDWRLLARKMLEEQVPADVERKRE